MRAMGAAVGAGAWGGSRFPYAPHWGVGALEAGSFCSQGKTHKG